MKIFREETETECPYDLCMDEYVNLRMLNAIYFPYMAWVEETDESLIFWNTDYKLYDNNMEGFFFQEEAQYAGFICLADEREPVSGSEKYKIER